MADPSDEPAVTSDRPQGPVREREVRSDRRMSDVEAMMWNVEKDPFLSSTFGSVTLLDQPPDIDRLRRRLLHMVQRIQRLHQRVVPALGRFAPPEWHDDPDFDIDYHLRHVALPAPGSPRQLYDLASQIVQDPFDRTRPLWEFVLIDGIEGGRGAMVQKMHHTITDGEGGIRMFEQFIDLARDAADVDEITITSEPPPPDAHILETAVDTFAHTFRRTVGIAHRAVTEGAEAVRHPSRLVAMPGDLAALAGSTVRQVTITDHAHSPLWTERSLRRRLETLDVEFDAAYRAAKALGGSLNDFFVTGAAGGAGAYHRSLGEPVETLRMAMPISTRTDKTAGGNSFVPTRELVPAGIEDPVERFTAVHETLNRTKGEKILGVVNGAAGFVNMLPTSVLVRFARQQTATVDFTTSNVRAANFDLYIGGGLILGTYPLGPLAGTAFNLTMMSYRGQLNMGLYIDTGAIADPELLRTCLTDAFAELIAAGS